MKSSRFFILQFGLITTIFGCSSPIHFEEIYDSQCDHTVKIIQSSPNHYETKNTCRESECFVIQGAVYLTITLLAAIDHALVQQAEFDDYKKACEQKGIHVTQLPKGELIDRNSPRANPKFAQQDPLKQIEVY